MPTSKNAILAPVLTLFLLGGVWADRAILEPSATASEQYHQRIREKAHDLPIYIGTWLGTEAPVPPSAVKLLRPNVIISRTYQDAVSGRQVAFLLVHCKDARDLLGHWPPVCYVGQGWMMQQAAPRDWQVDDLNVTGIQYEFASSRCGRAAHMSVDGFFILPGGRLCRSMDEVDAVARDPGRKFFGAAQVQILSDGRLSGSDREETLAMFVRAARPVIEALGEGVSE